MHHKMARDFLYFNPFSKYCFSSLFQERILRTTFIRRPGLHFPGKTGSQKNSPERISGVPGH